MKFDDTSSLSHTIRECKYRIAFAPKFRRRVIYGRIKKDIGIIIGILCERKGVELIEAEVCSDHTHILVSIPPKMNGSSFMEYFVSTVGKNRKVIQDYIGNQLREDMEADQISMKKYIAPCKG